MVYEGFSTFKADTDNGVLSVTFDYGSVNVQGLPMLADLNMLAQKLEADSSVKVVVFQSAHPEIFVCHADTNFLKDMSDTAVSRDEVKLLDLQIVLERISKLPQATIAKIEGFARGGGHEFALYPSYLKMPASELSQRFQDKAHLRRNVVTFRTSVTQ